MKKYQSFLSEILRFLEVKFSVDLNRHVFLMAIEKCHYFAVKKKGPYLKLCYSIQLPASVAQLDAPSDWRPGGCGFNPRRGRQHSFMEIDHEIFSMVILSLLLIQEGQLSVSGKRMCSILVDRLED